MHILQKQWPILFFMFCSFSLYANNLKIENVTLTRQNTTDDYTMVQFDISWDNSWRNIVNYDAAWVFVKYKGHDGLWQHARLDNHDPAHTAPAGSVINGTLYNGSYGPGVFIYRDANGRGSNDWNHAQLRWNYGENGVGDGDLVTIKVFAIEMVYVPQGAFDLGDGSSGSTTHHFYDVGSGYTQPFVVNEQSSIILNPVGGAGYLWAVGSIDVGSSVFNFPTGYNAFYCMKYEITQEQYMEFLNTLTRTQQNTRTYTDISGTSITNRYVMSNSAAISYRNDIRCDATIPASGPITVYCDCDGDGSGNEDNDGQNIACNWLSWMDGCAYADWAGLRPITELEHEKACRGDQAAVAGEYTWGNGNIHVSAYILTNAGYYNEVINRQPSGTGNASYHYTDGSINGPLRAGIFALSSTTRQEAGASNYGIMEMSGNLFERTVTIGNDYGRVYTGNHGGGGLSINGNANNVASWPGANRIGEVTGASGSGFRGGAWNMVATSLRVSDRISATNAITFRSHSYGFRCVRSY